MKEMAETAVPHRAGDPMPLNTTMTESSFPVGPTAWREEVSEYLGTLRNGRMDPRMFSGRASLRVLPWPLHHSENRPLGAGPS